MSVPLLHSKYVISDQNCGLFTSGGFQVELSDTENSFSLWNYNDLSTKAEQELLINGFDEKSCQFNTQNQTVITE